MLAPDSFLCPRCRLTSWNGNDLVNAYCGNCHMTVEDMRNEPVTEFAHFCPTKLTRRDCFSLAILCMVESPDCPEARLVHGWVKDSFHPGQYVQHAWCEFPATATYSDGSEGPIIVVHDLSQLDENARFIPRELAYELMGMRDDLKRFTRSEAITKALLHGHDGPWDSSQPNRKRTIWTTVRS